MQTYLVVLSLLAVATAAMPAAEASHMPCIEHDHVWRFTCMPGPPDLSDPTCIEWFFVFGEASICPQDWLP